MSVKLDYEDLNVRNIHLYIDGEVNVLDRKDVIGGIRAVEVSMTDNLSWCFGWVLSDDGLAAETARRRRSEAMEEEDSKKEPSCEMTTD